MSLLRLARPRLYTTQPCPLLLRTFVTTPSLHSDVVLPRLPSDLKDAMRAKDKPRLEAIRTLKSAITNASKTTKPIDDDARLLSLLRNLIKASNGAIEEFASAKRDDLVQKEKGQRDIMECYVREIPQMSVEEVESILAQAAGELKEAGKEGKALFGQLMGKVQKQIAGRPHDADYVATRVSEIAGVEKK